ncbi:DinB family protein [Kitasatospora sp. NBC_01287]|uniref:DinB family protein n=1 Tax=Kitasatospora sp. NBC_01287 TaxID=2903573 RepID=UPI002259C256|nr:DinB family protein [Kitasatospora sp. NBC_01287]MCX4748215.1 DinB family protein [Kitasatospora sp. NBC_01287]
MTTVVRAENSERDAFLAFLAAQRAALRRAVHGLTDEQASAAPTASTLCLAGLVKHAVFCERTWIVGILMGRPVDRAGSPEQWAEQFRLLPGETLEQWLKAYADVEAETEEIINGLPDLEVDAALPKAPWFPENSRRTARWILLHLIAEVGRHCGHADIIRETLDGRTAFEPVAAVGAEA